MSIHPSPIQQLAHRLPLGQHYYLVSGVSFQRLLCIHKHIYIHTITRNSTPPTTAGSIVQASISRCSRTRVGQTPKSWTTQVKGYERASFYRYGQTALHRDCTDIHSRQQCKSARFPHPHQHGELSNSSSLPVWQMKKWLTLQSIHFIS